MELNLVYLNKMKEKRVNQLKKIIILTFEKAKAFGINFTN